MFLIFYFIFLCLYLQLFLIFISNQNFLKILVLREIQKVLNFFICTQIISLIWSLNFFPKTFLFRNNFCPSFTLNLSKTIIYCFILSERDYFNLLQLCHHFLCTQFSFVWKFKKYVLKESLKFNQNLTFIIFVSKKSQKVNYINFNHTVFSLNFGM